MKVGDVFVALGFKTDDTGLKRFDTGIKNLRLNIGLTAAAFTAALYAIDRFVESTTRGATAMVNFQIQTGLSMEELQRWQNAATLSNTALSVDQVTASITGLQARLADIQLNGGGQAFQRLGISTIGKSAFDVLTELRDKIQNVPRPIAANLLQEMGLSPEFLNVLTLTNDEFDRLSNTFSRSQQMQKELAGLQQSITLFRKELEFAKDKIVVALMPALRVLMKVLEFLVQIVERLTTNLKSIGDKALESKYGIIVLAGAFGILLKAVGPVTRSLGLLLLLLDDVATYMTGGDSLTGRAIKAFEGSIPDQILKAGGSTMKKAVGAIGDAFTLPDTSFNPAYAGDTPYGNYDENGNIIDENGNIVLPGETTPIRGAGSGGDVDPISGLAIPAGDTWPDGSPKNPRLPVGNVTMNVSNTIHTRDDADSIARAIGASSGKAVERAFDQLNNGAKN